MSAFLSQAHACDEHHDAAVGTSHAVSTKSDTGTLEDTFSVLKQKLGVLVTRKFKEGVPAITLEDINVLEKELSYSFSQEMKDFFLTCGNLRWQAYNFPYVKSPTSLIWTFFKEQDCASKNLVPFCEINDSNGWFCSDALTKEVVSFFPNSHRSSCHHAVQKWSSLQHFLLDYLKLLESAQDL